MEFKDLNFNNEILAAAKQMGITKVNLIEEKIIPSIVNDNTVLFKTDFTLQKIPGFILPLSDMAVKGNINNVLIIEPTREMAGIVNNYIKLINASTGLKSMVVCGGHDVFREIRDLRKGFRFLSATPGRLLDHLKRNTIDINSFDTVVLDNFDKTIKMEFLDQVNQIFEVVRAKRLFVFAKGEDDLVNAFISKYNKDYKVIDLTNVNMVDNQKISVTSESKFDVLHRLLDKAKGQRVIIFTSSRATSEELRRKMWEVAFKVGKINGETPLEDRYAAIEDLRTHKKTVLVATDVLSRSLKFDNLKYIVMYDKASSEELTGYRMDRFGRLDDFGSVIEFVQTDDNKPSEIDNDDVVKELQEGIKEGRINPKVKFAKMVSQKVKASKEALISNRFSKDSKPNRFKQKHQNKESVSIADEHNRFSENKFNPFRRNDKPKYEQKKRNEYTDSEEY